MKRHWERAIAFTGAVLFLGSALHAEEKCSAEVKLLLSPPTIQTVIASLSFKNETAGRIYFYDTGALDLQRQGVIVRVRQGAANDLTVKVRVPDSSGQDDTSRLRTNFACEINRTGAGEDTDYSVKRKYTTEQVPESGADLFKLLSPAQKTLLQEARVSIDWTRVRKLADIKSTQWESTPQPQLGRLALELWEWSSASVLEISAKAGPDAERSMYAELQQLVHRKGLSLNTSQGSKTSMILGTPAHRTAPLR
ncbi:MAG: hypothetical protein WBV41_17400 [Terriglobales bacterium]